MQISLTNLNYTLSGVQIQKKKKKKKKKTKKSKTKNKKQKQKQKQTNKLFVFFKKFYDQKQNAHIMLNEQMQK